MKRSPGLIVVGAAVLCCSATAALGASLTAPKNIILITCDTLRADHLGCYGYRRNTSPFIDEFAKEATLFKTAIAPIPSTNQSHTSIFTGLYPQRHGVIDNKPQEVFPGVKVLPALLQEKGILAAAVVSGWTLKRGGSKLHEYFNFYDDDFTDAKQDASVTTGKVIGWLRKNSEKRFFLWAHYFDPHGNYLPPVRYVQRFYPVAGEKLLRYYGLDLSQREEIINSEKAKEQLIAQYDGEIAYVDECLRKVFGVLRELGLYDNALIILTADHGESLTEHDYYFDHSLCLYDDSLKVPLLIKMPAPASSVGSIDEQVGLIDIMPTVLTAVRCSYDGAKLDGRDLSHLIANGGRAGVRAYYAKTFIKQAGCDSACIRTERYKYIYTYPWWSEMRMMGAQEELYDLKKDPKELCNIAAHNRRICEQMKRELFAWEASGAPHLKSVESPRLSEKDLKMLKSLGYMQ